MIYAFYEKDGSLGETVATDIITAGSDGSDVIAVYWDKDAWRDSDCDATIKYSVIRGSTWTAEHGADEIALEAMPIDPKRDYRRFVADREYKFALFKVPTSILRRRGSIVATIRVFDSEGDEIKALTDLTFEVNGSYAYDSGVTESQYNYIVKQLADRPTNAQVSEGLGTVRDEAFARADLYATPHLVGQSTIANGKAVITAQSMPKGIYSLTIGDCVTTMVLATDASVGQTIMVAGYYVDSMMRTDQHGVIISWDGSSIEIRASNLDYPFADGYVAHLYRIALN